MSSLGQRACWFKLVAVRGAATWRRSRGRAADNKSGTELEATLAYQHAKSSAVRSKKPREGRGADRGPGKGANRSM